MYTTVCLLHVLVLIPGSEGVVQGIILGRSHVLPCTQVREAQRLGPWLKKSFRGSGTCLKMPQSQDDHNMHMT